MRSNPADIWRAVNMDFIIQGSLSLSLSLCQMGALSGSRVERKIILQVHMKSSDMNGADAQNLWRTKEIGIASR